MFSMYCFFCLYRHHDLIGLLSGEVNIFSCCVSDSDGSYYEADTGIKWLMVSQYLAVCKNHVSGTEG